ncbi:hypothetical protein D9757_009123 [Collybiopsis confluens]|uniref:Uncharacterized protein n=1 Tax=Collybiopsis confluens TaxID=2823264 RepID=A0A8H5H977_9AGAR|nr:hypothetical protein D9757_009123 [Collybiopsis confluens]
MGILYVPDWIAEELKAGTRCLKDYHKLSDPAPDSSTASARAETTPWLRKSFIPTSVKLFCCGSKWVVRVTDSHGADDGSIELWVPREG